MLKFTLRDLFWLTLVAALVVALVYAKRPIAPGRYQFVATGGNGANYVLDTVSGQIWIQNYPDDQWREHPSPVLSDDHGSTASTGSTPSR